MESAEQHYHNTRMIPTSTAYTDGDALPVELDWLTDTLETGNLSDLHRSLSSGNDLSTSHRSSVQMSRSGSFANLSAMSYPSSPTPTETENLRNSAQSHIVSSTTTFLTSNSDSFGDCDSVVSFTGISHSHPLTMAKHICSICGDRASGKHYGVYSCEGCKGFFKRTVRKDLTYGCRENRQCIIDKRQRNRCQYCRYQKCLFMGMKREAVQEERHRLRSDRSDGEPESTSNFMPDMPPNQIYEAELLVDQSHQDQENINVNQLNSSEAVERQIRELVDWARMLPHFMDLSVEDQSLLIHTGWNELILASVAFRSSTDTLLFPCGQRLTSSIARQSGLDDIYERIRTELTAKLRELNVDRTELGCLRAIVLFNPDAVGLKQSASVESCREKVYCCLEEFCRQSYPTEPGRFAKLLLRLPALRSIGIKSLDMSVSLIPPVPTLACLQQLIHSSPQIPHSSDEDFCLF